MEPSNPYKGKYCAHVEIALQENDYKKERGILFVKRCGIWKICGYNGDVIIQNAQVSLNEMIELGAIKLCVLDQLFQEK